MKKPKEPSRLILTAILAAFVFCVLVITMVLVGVTVYLLVNAGVIHSPHFAAFLVTIAFASIIVGTIISFFLAKVPMVPVYRLIYAMNLLAAGKYDTRLSLHVPKVGKDLEECFNTLAKELQNTEMLRSDFINNFSHEFKTPLVSMKGFANILKSEDLSEEERQEYLSIIASESTRLSDMATKVLDLTKLENQSILTDITEFNVSEQLRECILLLESRWTEKNLDVSAYFGEETIHGNEEMLKQVWINLLDNAIKFSPENGILKTSMERTADTVRISISNNGPEISDEDKKRIFQKFYQADAAHRTSGNGIGLAIVQKIVALHEGAIMVECKDGITTFTVSLPCE